MVSFSPITRHERQIPRGGKAEGRMPFRRGRVLPVRCAGLPHCGITAKNCLFFGGGLIASVRRAARRVNLIRVGSFRTHTVRPSGLAFHRRPPRAVAWWGEASRRAACPPTAPSIHPHRRRVPWCILFSHARHSLSAPGVLLCEQQAREEKELPQDEKQR